MKKIIDIFKYPAILVTLPTIIAIKILIIAYIKDRIRYYKSPENYVKSQIYILFRAIQNKDSYKNNLDAVSSFCFLADKFEIASNKVYLEILTPEAFVYNWNKLTQYFIDILNNYKLQAPRQRPMAPEEIDKLINELRIILEKPYEIKCFSCHTKISLKENKCPNCGWTWNQSKGII